ncbi:MAG: hypothetical protein DMD76_14400 [Candidatus Rokuibacteriota bacterium]|nr:MAG: hypothetical protein DMD76_14400 [Candidatus Rokubacteria bacterium]
MSVRWALTLVLVAGAAEAGSSLDTPGHASTAVRCGEQTLAACTQRRVEALQRLGATLKRAAGQQPAKPPTDPKARGELARYDRWLTLQSERAEKLVAEGRRALGAGKDAPDRQMSFNLQYLQLQSQMQNENHAYTAVSNIMKTKHDTVKNSISNIR